MRARRNGTPNTDAAPREEMAPNSGIVTAMATKIKASGRARQLTTSQPLTPVIVIISINIPTPIKIPMTGSELFTPSLIAAQTENFFPVRIQSSALIIKTIVMLRDGTIFGSIEGRRISASRTKTGNSMTKDIFSSSLICS